MRALRYDAFGPTQDVLRVVTVPEPVPGPGDLLVRVRAAGVNPLDWKLVEGQFRLLAKSRPPCGVGAEFAGEVAGVGSAAGGIAVGERVSGWLDPFRQPPAACAEWIAVPAAQCVRLPAGVSFEDGAVAPVAGLSALQLVRMIDVRAGQRVLVHGAAGGIGSFVVPLLRDAGATVVATSSTRSQAFLASLAPTAQVDYATPAGQWGAPFDAVIDCASRLNARSIAALLPRGGPLAVTLPAFPGMLFDPLLNRLRRVRRLTLRLTPNASALAQLLARMADGRVTARVTQRVPLDRAADALAASRTGHVQGKIVVVP